MDLTPEQLAQLGPALMGQPGELRITLEIKRAATGQTETVELIGRMTGEGDQDGSHA